MLDRLEKAGHITREPNPEDRRSSIVRPVASSLRKLEAIYRSKDELLFGVLSGYKNTELDLLMDFFSKTNRGTAAEPESGE